ncbi:MAG: DNA repair protein RecN [Vulcanimicrobiaceae bacterium]
MLKRLLIEDFGLIARADIEFASRASIFTGETGSGKTMVIGALAFVLGGRAGPDVVRRGARRSVVTLTLDASPALRERFAAGGFILEDDEDALLSREMSEAGKSVLRLNGRQTTAGYVRDLTADIAEIIGQHEAQRLLSPEYHLELLDRLSGAAAAGEGARLRDAYVRAQDASAALAAFHTQAGKAQAEVEFARFAAREIAAANVQPEEDVQLESRRRYLENAERIASALRLAHEALAGERGAGDALGEAASALSPIASINAQLGSAFESASTLQQDVTELALTLSRLAEETEFSPSELDELHARANALDSLKRKYGGTLPAILASGQRYAATVEAFASRDERCAELEAHAGEARGLLEQCAATLTILRTKAAKALERRIQDEFGDLALSAARFSVLLNRREQIAADGAESAEFVFSANAGEPLLPLAKVASGGELSRVLLALIVSLLETREPTTLIFDEIDAGIGGVTAGAVASRRATLGKSAQVVCVTHLAQIASHAQRHFVLEKREAAGGTTIAVREVTTRAARARERARMLSGEPQGVALEHAEALLRAAAG